MIKQQLANGEIENMRGRILFCCACFVLSLWAKTMAINIRAQPENSCMVSPCPKRIQPANALNTLSRDNARLAIVGLRSFCAISCKVKPTPVLKIPAYRIGIAAAEIASHVGCSKRNIQTVERIAETKNWIQLIFTLSTLGEVINDQNVPGKQQSAKQNGCISGAEREPVHHAE